MRWFTERLGHVHYTQCSQSSDEERGGYNAARKAGLIRTKQESKKQTSNPTQDVLVERKYRNDGFVTKRNDVMASPNGRQYSTESTDRHVRHVTWDIEKSYRSKEAGNMTTQALSPILVEKEKSFIDEGSSKSRKHTKKLSRTQTVQDVDFDQLFEHPELSASQRRQAFKDQQYGDSVDEGIASLEVDDDLQASRPSLPTLPEIYINDEPFRLSTTSCFTRADSVQVMELPFREILKKHTETSHGFVGFRRRVANDINTKYCSYYRCDDVVFLFLYTVFGIVYISAGSLGLIHCSEEFLINVYLIADGILSIFIFPITIMKWTKRIGGCLDDDEKLGSGVFFYTVLGLRTVAGTLGTAILVFRVQSIISDEALCRTIVTLINVGVALEWAFLLFGIIIPMCFYVGVYMYAYRYL